MRKVRPLRCTKGRTATRLAEASVERTVRDEVEFWPLADETDSARLAGKPVICRTNFAGSRS